MPDRTPEQREADRLAREAKRAKREGRAPPSPPPKQPSDRTYAPSASETPITSPEPEPPATGRDWRRAAGDPDPDPPLVRRVESAGPREEIHGHDEPLPEPARPAPPGRRIPPAPAADEPIGTKRISARQRFHRPHLAQRPPRDPASVSAGTRWGRRVGAILALAAVAVVLWFAASLFQPFAGAGAGSVTVQIPEGASVGEVGDVLVANEVVASSFFFGLRARLEGKDDQLNSGRIELKKDMSYAAAIDALTRPAPPAPKLTKLVVPEGISRGEIARIVADSGLPGDYMKATESFAGFNPARYGAPADANLEGFLFPATYELKAKDDAEDLVRQQLRAFRRNLAEVDLTEAKRKNLTAYDVVSIASMIDREAGIPEDRRRIAAVIYNRLRQGISLGIDATLRYELNNWTEPLKVSELEADTPYNTRTNLGLPPGPIGNPGLAALQAAANPANVDYLYYVVRPCGGGASNFSSTDAEFQQDVAAYNAKREELGGRHPVDC